MSSTTEATQSQIPTEPRSIPQQLTQPQDDQLPSATPVELSDMTTAAQRSAGKPLRTASTSSDQPPTGPMRTDTATALSQSTNPALTKPTNVAERNSSPSRNRATSTAIGPNSDSPIVPSKDEVPETGPTLMITLLLTSGARHPFKLDGKYLQKRNVEAQSNDPFNLSVYKLKELILREWREDWESKPSSPSSIRLISFGKLLDDKAALKDAKLNTDAANVLHMTIKPQDFVEEEDSKGGKASFGNAGDGDRRSPGCRCVIM